MSWPIKKITEVCEPIKIEKVPVGTVPYIEIGDIDVKTKEINYKNKGAVKGSIFAPNNCVIVSQVRPTRGAVALIDKRIAISAAFTILKPKPDLKLKFLFYYLAYNTRFFEHLGTRQKGSNYPSCRERDILNYEISLPPLSEQKRITASIEESFKKIDKASELRQKTQKETKQIFTSAAQEIFDKAEKKYNRKTLKETLNLIQYGLSKKMNELGNGYKIFRMNNIVNCQMDDKNMKYVEIDEKEFLKYKLEEGDILFNRVNSFELVGKTGIFNLNGDYVFASYLIRLRTNPVFLNPWFLNYFLNSTSNQRKLRLMARRAVQQANINAREISSIQIPLPPIFEQKRIVAHLNDLKEKTEKLTQLQVEQAKELEELKKSLLEKYLYPESY